MKPHQNKYEEDRLKMVEDYNMDYCGVCETPGTLICCETCPSAYHIECLGFERVIFVNLKTCSHRVVNGNAIFAKL